MLELLSDVGQSQGLEEARYLVEGARSLCMDVLDILLAHLKRIKVARLAHSECAVNPNDPNVQMLDIVAGALG